MCKVWRDIKLRLWLCDVETLFCCGDIIGDFSNVICHAPAALKDVKNKDGEPLVKGRKVTGFTNSEEEAVQLTDVVPFLVEDILKKNGGIYSKADDWKVHVLVDGNLITGQNPASSKLVAKKILNKLK